MDIKLLKVGMHCYVLTTLHGPTDNSMGTSVTKCEIKRVINKEYPFLYNVERVDGIWAKPKGDQIVPTEVLDGSAPNSLSIGYHVEPVPKKEPPPAAFAGHKKGTQVDYIGPLNSLSGRWTVLGHDKFGKHFILYKLGKPGITEYNPDSPCCNRAHSSELKVVE
jgi:hypothetical protein